MSTPVQAGEQIRASSWNAAGRTVRALQLISGPGVRLRSTPNGTIVNFSGGNAIFLHPFKVTLTGLGVRVRWGQINGVDGTINDKLIQPVYEDTEPTLTVNKFKLDKSGRGWVAAEVTCSPKNWDVESWKVVQVADLDTDDGATAVVGAEASGSKAGGVPNLPGRRARQPLAMLVARSTRVVSCHQVTYFHLQHRVRAAEDPKADAARHFFFPKG